MIVSCPACPYSHERSHEGCLAATASEARVHELKYRSVYAWIWTLFLAVAVLVPDVAIPA